MSKLGHIYMINDGVLYTNNNGYDKLIKLIIPLSEFLEDCHFLSTFKEFKEMCEFPAHWENQRHVEIDIWVCGYLKKNLMQMLCDQFDIIDNMLIGLDFECIF